jgi:hypothetical protein
MERDQLKEAYEFNRPKPEMEWAILVLMILPTE